MSAAWARRLAWTGVGLTLGMLALTRLIVAQPHPGKLGMETEAAGPIAFFGLLAFSIVGALILSRHPRHPIGWIFAGSGLAGGLSAASEAYAELGTAVPGSLPAVWLANALSGGTFLAGFFLPISVGLLLFPDGKLPSRRWRPTVYVAIAALILQAAGSAIGPSRTLGLALEVAGGLGSVLTALAAVASLGVRWRRVSGEAKQQLKWVAVAGTVVCLVVAVELLLMIFRPELVQGRALLYFSVAYASVALAVGIAILRFGLYEIDFLINRAIVYVSLSAILAGLYAGSTALFQRTFIALTGQSSEAAVIITVFLLATVFSPVRNWLQGTVDRRFKDARDLERAMAALARDVQSVIDVTFGRRLAERLLSDATSGATATGAALYLDGSTADRPTLTHGNWDGEAALTVPLRTDDRELGRMALGRRRTGARYTSRDVDCLQRTADTVALALSLAGQPAVHPPGAGAPLSTTGGERSAEVS